MNDVIAWVIAAGVVFALTGTGAANGILNALDLSDNLRNAASWAQGVRGLPAGVVAVCFFILAYVFGGLSYRYDLIPTWKFIQPIVADVATISDDWLVLFGVFLTLLPTLIELATAGLVQRDIKALQYIVYFFIGFDIVTDYSEAVALINRWKEQALFAPLPDVLEGAVIVLAKIGWTFAASFGFEFLCILFAVTGLLLAANSGRGGSGGKP